MSGIEDKKSDEFLSKSHKYRSKSDNLKLLIRQAIAILEILGIPFDTMRPRGVEKMALTFLAVIGKTPKNKWGDIKDCSDSVSLQTRRIIELLNAEYEEKISSGSYDDIRRKDLKLLVLGQIVQTSNPELAKNDPKRGYALNPFYSELLKKLDFMSLEQWVEYVHSKLHETV